MCVCVRAVHKTGESKYYKLQNGAIFVQIAFFVRSFGNNWANKSKSCFSLSPANLSRVWLLAGATFAHKSFTDLLVGWKFPTLRNELLSILRKTLEISRKTLNWAFFSFAICLSLFSISLSSFFPLSLERAGTLPLACLANGFI